MGKLFGTDGIRGVANAYPITSEMAVKVGKAVAYLFKDSAKSNSVVIGKDTRISGDMLISGIVSGICAMGVDAYVVDVFPTPGIAFLTKFTNSNAGIMISASHNPFEDNGIKIFDAEGYKPSVKTEEEIERVILEYKCDTLTNDIKYTGIIKHLNNSTQTYSDFLINALPHGLSLKGLKVILDCANGATHKIAPGLFMGLGASVESHFIQPDGKNINKGCGSQHTEKLREVVLETHADIGLAFDGDGDRLIAVDDTGNILTGDQIMFICANVLKKQGDLKNDMVVSTVMSNLGFKEGLLKSGIQTIATDVGDRHVMEKMKSVDVILGGEDSGHTIFLNHHTTGDGMLTALKLVESVLYEKKPLSELAARMNVFPQVLINVAVKSKPDLKTIPEITQAISEVENKLGDKGRVLVRYSGTQAMCRVMVEGPTKEYTQQYAQYIADIIKNKLG